ncbi:hypothetical protein ACWD3I_02000 [Streptomyces sp. NPDC002817]|uniref:hypothetical protein n=1 Tax=Streptomyces sp. NPDC088357 TaxID=3154655 RepID=UPI003422A8AD
MGWYDASLVALGCGLLLTGTFTVVTGRIVFLPVTSVVRPRMTGAWELCYGLIGLGHLPQLDLGGTANLTLMILGAMAARLAWWTPSRKGPLGCAGAECSTPGPRRLPHFHLGRR